MNLYVALLRGINVGGNNPIRMSALKACLEADGFRDVATYIQSGNVLFASGRSNQALLTRQIEATLAKTFASRPRVVVRSFAEIKAIVENAPRGFGRRSEDYRYDVVFLKEPLIAGEAVKSVATKPGVDRVVGGEGVLYFSRLISKAGQSYLPRLVGTPVYQNMTIRNWNTTGKLLELMERVRIGA